MLRFQSRLYLAGAHCVAKIVQAEIVEGSVSGDDEEGEGAECKHISRFGFSWQGSISKEYACSLRGAVREVWKAGSKVEKRDFDFILEKNIVGGQAAVEDIFGVKIREGVGSLV